MRWRRAGSRHSQLVGGDHTGGQALARYVLDHPETVAGRRVLDLGAGSGLVAVAALQAGAAHVLASDPDPYSHTAIALNAEVVPRGMWACQLVSEGDLIEILTATQGG